MGLLAVAAAWVGAMVAARRPAALAGGTVGVPQRSESLPLVSLEPGYFVPGLLPAAALPPGVCQARVLAQVVVRLVGVWSDTCLEAGTTAVTPYRPGIPVSGSWQGELTAFAW